ncbi:MAG TPA: helix-turn-helix domain-containing protein [Candidatus Izemoplasmatales bacterium]|nr:helix-turn-helix domain-containing protein [Candidatus Izemoplasmatales bacterium]
MKERLIYLHLRHGDEETFRSALPEFGPLSSHRRPDGIIEIIDPGFDDPSRYQQIREMAMQEFFQDFAAFIRPDSPHFDAEPFLPLLRKANPGIYAIADMIEEVVEGNHLELKNRLKKYYYTLFGAETIETVLGFIKADQNASRAAADLYMHRNTLNYRLDHFVSVSEIDIRSFRGAVAVYLLFR